MKTIYNDLDNANQKRNLFLVGIVAFCIFYAEKKIYWKIKEIILYFVSFYNVNICSYFLLDALYTNYMFYFSPFILLKLESSCNYKNKQNFNV